VVSGAGKVLVDQVEGVPSEEDRLIESLGLSVGGEGLVGKRSDIELSDGFEAFLLHPVAAVASKGDLVAAYSSQFIHDFGTR
jgi:hypothetical protein